MTARREILTRVLFPGLERFRRWMRTPLGSLGLAAAAAALCGLFLHPQGFVVFFGIVVVTTLGLIWPWLSVRGLDGSLTFDRLRCREGEAVTARIILRNRMPWAAWGISVQGGFEDPRGDRRSDIPLVGLAIVPGWRAIDEPVEFVPGCRGEYPGGPPRLVCGFPFGLWQAARPLAVSATLLVWPRTVPVAAVPEAKGSEAWNGLATRDRAGNWGDPMGVRPYRRGDPLRRVHWALTARHGQLIVREVQSNAGPRVQIVLDIHSSAHVGRGPDASCEWAIRIAASFAEGWIRQGTDVELVFGGASVSSRGGSARMSSAAVLDALARMKTGGERELLELLSRPKERCNVGLRVIVTTDVGLRGLTRESTRGYDDRFVVLKAGAFGAGAEDASTASSPIVPWIEIDGPGRVAACLRGIGQGVAIGR